MKETRNTIEEIMAPPFYAERESEVRKSGKARNLAFYGFDERLNCGEL